MKQLISVCVCVCVCVSYVGVIPLWLSAIQLLLLYDVINVYFKLNLSGVFFPRLELLNECAYNLTIYYACDVI